MLDADPVRLAQVFANLLNNAAKYTDARRPDRARRAARRRTCVVAVRDNGIGIRRELLPHVFEMFIAGRAPRSTRSQGGLGIGLTLVRSLVELHGGTIEARSDGPRAGQRVHRAPAARAVPRTAPRRRGEARRRRAVAGPAHPRRRRQPRRRRELAHAAARCSGTTCTSRTTGRARSRRCEPCNRTSAVLDIGMPGMDGYEVARRVRAGPRGERRPVDRADGLGPATKIAGARARPASTIISSSRST